MTAVLCAIAITLTPTPADCQRGGHAVAPPSRGGHALLVVLPPVGNVRNWTCIHQHEGAWNDTGDPYWGGLQMDRPFMRSYGSDFIRLHAGEGAGGEGLADSWTPREQMVAAQRAYVTRGYHPWPNTARMCGLL